MIIAYGSGGKLISSRWFSVGISHVFEIRWWLGLESSKLPFICLLLVPRTLKLVEWENWSLVQLLSRVWLFVTPWTAAYQASLSFTISWSLLKFMSIELVVLSNHLILCCLLLLLSIFPSLRAFPNELALCIRWPKGTILPMNIQGWFPLGLTSLISLQSKGLLRVFSSTTI